MSMHNNIQGLTIPPKPYTIRKDAYLHSNGYSIMNASVMLYGGAKTGKTRLLIAAFKGANYIFLDFDRNYESTVNDIIKSGAQYFNGDGAYDVLYQLMLGGIYNAIVIIDALGSVVKPLCKKFIEKHKDKNDKLYADAQLLSDAIHGIGINHADSVTFFNLVIEPMTKNGNSINFVHHTTQNSAGEKMEGNKGAWMSVFDFTYEMDRISRTFKLEAGRLPIAVESIGEDNIYDRINKTIRDNAEIVEVDSNQISVTKYSVIHNNKSYRKIMNAMVKEGIVKKKKYKDYGKTEFLEADYGIDANGQNKITYDDNGDISDWVPIYPKDNSGSGSE